MYTLKDSCSMAVNKIKPLIGLILLFFAAVWLNETFAVFPTQAQHIAATAPAAPHASPQPAEVQAASVTLARHFVASADAYVDSSAPDVNFGESLFLEIGTEPNLSPAVQTEAWLAFDLSSVPLGATVDQATLQAVVQPGGFGPDAWVTVRPPISAWEEISLTWNLRPALDQTWTISYPFATSATTLTWDLTQLVSAWVGQDIPNHGFALQSQATGDDWLRFLHSRESESPPELVVTYTLSGDAYVFSGAVQEVGFGPPDDNPMAGITMTLYASQSPDGGLGALVDQTTTDAQGEYYFHYTPPLDSPPITYTLVMSDSDYTVVNAFPQDKETAEGYIRYPDDTAPGLYESNVFHIEPATWPTWVTREFSGTVFYAGGSEPAPNVEVVLYGADVPEEPRQVLAGASTAADGTFRLPITLEPSEVFTYYVLQVADFDFQTVSAGPGPGGSSTEDHRIVFQTPDPGSYPGNSFEVQAVVTSESQPTVSQAAELRPVVAVLLTPQCTCGFADCTTITNPNVLTAFGQTLFNATGDSVHNYFLENSQGHLGLQQAGLFQVVPMDDPSTATANESTNCPIPGRTPEQHRAYVTQRVLGQQLNFNFANFDRDSDGTVEEDELIVLLAATDRHTGNARMRTSNPRTVQVGNTNVRVYYIMVQPGTDFYTIAHETSHALPYTRRSGIPGDLYGGAGNAGTYSLMDNHCHGRVNELDPNTPYTPTQHIRSRRPHLDPWNKIAQGWITPTVLSGSGGGQTLDPVETNGTVYKLYPLSHGDKEYFLVENRWPAASQYETQLPDSGLAIWHINENYLPDQRRAVALERAGGGANSGAATNFCNDDNDTTALWDGAHDFHGASTPSSDWYSGTNSGVAVLCIGAPDTQVSAYLSANWSQTVLPEDAGEPNNAASTAASVSPGSYDRTLHAPCDTDYYTLTHWMKALITVTVSAYHDAGHIQPAPAPQVRISDDNFYTTFNFQGTGIVTGYLPFKGVATIEVYGSSTPVYYRMTVASSQPTIPPDRFDDQQPPGEVRNDSLAASAVITDAINEYAVLIPGLTIYDLNLEQASDVDYFTIQLPPQVNPTTGYSECLPAGDPRLLDPATSQGYLTVQVFPYFKRPFTITTYTSSGTPVTNHDLDGPTMVRVKCPHDFFSDGQVVLRFDDLSGQVNFYEVGLYYNRWSQLKDFPEWLLLTDPPMFRPIPVLYDPLIRWIYPATPWVQEELLGGVAVPPLPTEYLPFHWDQQLPLTLDMLLLPSQSLNARLYDAQQNLIAEAGPLAGTVGAMDATPGSKRLYVPDLAPGWYALAVDGGEGLTEYLLQFHVWQVYLPLTLRNYP